MVLDQARLRGANRRFDAEAIDLGNEPPLSVDGGTGGLVDRRRLSLQWFSGTILTGLCGAALMGGAVFASLDGETNFAAAPERVEMALRGAIAGIGGRLSGIHKTDRLAAISEAERRAPDHARADQHARARSRAGSHAFFCARLRQSFAVGFRTLRQHSPVQSAKALTDGVANADDAPPAAEPDAEVSFVTCDFSSVRRKRQSGAGGLRLNSLLPKVKAVDASAAR